MFHSFFHPFDEDAGRALPADIPASTWRRFHRQRDVLRRQGSPDAPNPNAPPFDLYAEPGWDDRAANLDLLRYFYDNSVRVRETARVLMFGRLILEEIRRDIPNHGTLLEAEGIKAQLAALGYPSTPRQLLPVFQPGPSALVPSDDEEEGPEDGTPKRFRLPSALRAGRGRL